MTEKDIDGDELDDLARVTLFAVMARQHEQAALAHKQGIESPLTLPSERAEMERQWMSHLAQARDWARQRDLAADQHLAQMVLRDNRGE